MHLDSERNSGVGWNSIQDPGPCFDTLDSLDCEKRPNLCSVCWACYMVNKVCAAAMGKAFAVLWSDVWTLGSWCFLSSTFGKICWKSVLQVMAESQKPSVSLRSNQWSCSELTKGAELCASMAGLDLAVDPSKLDKSYFKRLRTSYHSSSCGLPVLYDGKSITAFTWKYGRSYLFPGGSIVDAESWSSTLST